MGRYKLIDLLAMKVENSKLFISVITSQCIALINYISFKKLKLCLSDIEYHVSLFSTALWMILASVLMPGSI